MVLQILFILILVTSAYTTQNGDSKEPATSYSIIYRYDTAEVTNDQSSNIKISSNEPEANEQVPKGYEAVSIGYDNMPFVYAKMPDRVETLKQINEIRVSQENDMKTYQELPSLSVFDFAPKDNQGNLNMETTSAQQTIQTIPILQSGSTKLEVNSGSSASVLTSPQLAKTVTYPPLISAPLVQEGRLLTPGLSAYASDSMVENESVKST
ncbi:unnamed protein product [Diatraea saccharalis]|uniref:Uncharacterized protein n=1 Tax=Diatraea saccharalis TaxID=40085 RepID=A0A9N9R1U8_9NEOP|nr:unnamed protein product [Diatraea saccharalis]